MEGIGTRIKDKKTSCQSISVNLQKELVILTQHNLSLFDLLGGPNLKIGHRSLQGLNLSILLHLFGKTGIVRRSQGESYLSNVRRIYNANVINGRGITSMISLEAKGKLSRRHLISKLSISFRIHWHAFNFPFLGPNG